MMRTSFHHLAYQDLEICNALSWASLEQTLGLAGLKPGDRALDLGCAYGRTSRLMARRFGLHVTANDADTRMLEGAHRATLEEGLEDQIQLVHGQSWKVLDKRPAYDLVLALGTTEPVGPGIRDPRLIFEGLANYLKPGGHLVWGDLTWTAEPPPPLRQLVEVTGYYAFHQEWQDAARAAGLEVRAARLSTPEEWAHYRKAMAASVQHWLDQNPDDPDAAAVAASAHRIKLMFDFGADCLGFGHYLFQKPGA